MNKKWIIGALDDWNRLSSATFVLAIFVAACGPVELSEDQIVADIRQHRLEKDLKFKESDNSPIPDTLRENFEGLSYFPIDLGYRFRAQITPHENKESFKIVTSSGIERDALKYGFLKFEMAGKSQILQVYKLLDIQDRYPNYLFVPFLDSTSGKEGYPGGRYLDFQENESGHHDLDFNLAYNPSCAYGKAGYNCPIPPAENRLQVAIRAGERYVAH